MATSVDAVAFILDEMVELGGVRGSPMLDRTVLTQWKSARYRLYVLQEGHIRLVVQQVHLLSFLSLNNLMQACLWISIKAGVMILKL